MHGWLIGIACGVLVYIALQLADVARLLLKVWRYEKRKTKDAPGGSRGVRNIDPQEGAHPS